MLTKNKYFPKFHFKIKEPTFATLYIVDMEWIIFLNKAKVFFFTSQINGWLNTSHLTFLIGLWAYAIMPHRKQ